MFAAFGIVTPNGSSLEIIRKKEEKINQWKLS